MKKITLTLTAVLCLATAIMHAQTYVGTFDGNPGAIGIPGFFTNSGHSYVTFISEDDFITIYDNDFSTCLANLYLEGSYTSPRLSCTYIDWSSTGVYSDGWQEIMFTQSLFNSDDNFEYVERLQTCWNIKSTDGNIVQTINTSDGFETGGVAIAKMDNLFYLLLYEHQNWQEGRYFVYRIDALNGLTKMETDIPISVFPNLVNRGQQITVELGEGNNATEITVVNGLGQIIKRVPVEEGQRKITIPAQELNSGLNVVSTRTQQGQGSCKIIVR